MCMDMYTGMQIDMCMDMYHLPVRTAGALHDGHPLPPATLQPAIIPRSNHAIAYPSIHTSIYTHIHTYNLHLCVQTQASTRARARTHARTCTHTHVQHLLAAVACVLVLRAMIVVPRLPADTTLYTCMCSRQWPTLSSVGTSIPMY